jgi:hypothetical protein
LVEAWNGFAGVAPVDELKPVKKFTIRQAVTRIWRARAYPRTLRNRRPTSRPSREGEEKSPAKIPRRARAQKDATESRSNKKAEVIAMMKRSTGAILAEIIEATAWIGTRFGTRQHPRQQGRAEDRVREERRRGSGATVSRSSQPR